MSEFNPYVEWLGLPAELVEPNHYQILGLPNFEADAARIGVAADKAMSRVRSFRPGPNAKAWSKLLDELLLAKGRLLDAERKQEYDADLRETTGAPKSETVASATATAATNDSAWDPRFPPGMGPNVGKSPPKPAATEPPQTVPEPARVPEPIAAPAPLPTPTPLAVAVAPVALPAMPVAVAPVPPTAWPTSMLHPVPHGAPAAAPLAQPLAQPAPQAQPVAASTQPAYPQQQPAYPQQQPTAYPQQPAYGYQPQPVYPQPPYGQPAPYAPAYGSQYGMPAYPAAPNYPAAQPQAYGAPQYPAYGMAPAAPPPAEPPVSYSSIGQFSMPAGQSTFGPTAHSTYALGDAAAAMPLDPMAPVAMPTAVPNQDDKRSRVVGFAAAQQAASAIPRGKAVSSSAATPTSAPAGEQLSAAAPPAAPSMLAPALAANSVEATVAAAYIEQDKGDRTLFYVSGGAILLLLGAIIFAVINANQGSPEIAQNPGVNVPSEPAPTPPVDQTKPKPPVTVKPPEPAKPKPPAVEPPKPVGPVQPPPVRKPPEEMPAENMPNETKPVPKPVEPKPVEPMPKPPEPTTIPVPMPIPPKPPEPAPEMKLAPAQVMMLSQALKSAKEALRERNFDETDKQLAIAKDLAKAEPYSAKFERLNLLTQYVKQFDRSMKTLMADENFDAGAELMMGTTRVVVVERSPAKIVIRINGQNRDYSLASMPDGLAMALIDKRLPPTDPVSKVIKGAHLAAAKVPTEINQEKAKELFAQAVQEGLSEIADLSLVITDSYDF